MPPPPCRWYWYAHLTRQLKALSQRHGVTLYMTLLTAWAVVLSRLSGQHDIVIGTPTANRARAELEGLIGFFVNTFALRLNVSGALKDVLAQAKSRALDAQAHQDVPFEQVVETIKPPRSLSHTPIFQVLLVLQNNERGELDLPGLYAAPAQNDFKVAKFDQELDLSEVDDHVEGILRYAVALFDEATVERHVGYLQRVLEALVSNPAQTVDQVELQGRIRTSSAAGRGGTTWQRTIRATPACTRYSKRSAARTPDALAIVHEQHSISYAALDRQSNQLARFFTHDGRGRGCARGDLRRTQYRLGRRHSCHVKSRCGVCAARSQLPGRAAEVSAGRQRAGIDAGPRAVAKAPLPRSMRVRCVWIWSRMPRCGSRNPTARWDTKQV